MTMVADRRRIRTSGLELSERALGSLRVVPVLVTAAHRPFARRLAARLLDEGGEVRVVAAGDVGSLRAAGAFVSVADPDDEGRLEAALADVHTVLHVGGGLATPDPQRLVDDAKVVARAAAGAGVQRVIGLSLPGAVADASDPLRRAKAAVEHHLASVPCPSVVVRAGLIDTPWLRDLLVTGGLDPQLLEHEVAPVTASDLLELLVAFDRARASAPDGHLVVAADGPQRLSLARYLERVGADRVGHGSLRGRRWPDPATIDRVVEVLAGPWWSHDPMLVDGWAFAQHEPAVPGI